MNNFALQSSLCALQTQFTQAMADKRLAIAQDSTLGQCIGLHSGLHRFTSATDRADYCLENYSVEEGVVSPNCAYNFIEKSQPEQQAMICLTAEFRKHTNDRQQVPSVKQDLPARKRFRTTFSPSQLKRLESEFRCSMYVVGLKRLRLAQELKLEERHIKIWFQNRRMKFKRDQKMNERNGLAFQNYGFY